MKFFVLCLLVLTVFSNSVQAQVMDVRAFSRQRGFKAYQLRQPSSPVQRQLNRNFKAEHASGRGEKTQNIADTGNEQHEKIRQTGIKIFQEKDEGKVLNFDVENPEFKKLNESKKKDLVRRITIE